MGHEGRRGGAGQDQSSAALAFSLFFGVRRLDAALPSSLVKNRTAEGPTLSKTKDERVGHPRIGSRVDLCSTRHVRVVTRVLLTSTHHSRRPWWRATRNLTSFQL